MCTLGCVSANLAVGLVIKSRPKVRGFSLAGVCSLGAFTPHFATRTLRGWQRGPALCISTRSATIGEYFVCFREPRWGTSTRRLKPAEGGTTALIKHGDTLVIEIPNRTIQLAVSDAELRGRHAAMSVATKRGAPSSFPCPHHERGARRRESGVAV
jgi:hypothetical protein